MPDDAIEFVTPTPIRVETTNVHCPYCRLGFVRLPLERTGVQVRIRHSKEPQACNLCGQYFLVKTEVRLVGVPIGSSAGPGYTPPKLYNISKTH